MSQHDGAHGDIIIGRSFRPSRRLRSAGFFAVFIAIMLGLTALAMQAAESNTRRIQQRITADGAIEPKATTTVPYTSQLDAKPVQPLATEAIASKADEGNQQAADATQTQALSSIQKSPACDYTKKAQAATTRSKKLRNETTRHRRAVWSLRTSGLVTRFLNPGMYNYRLSSEHNTHRKNVKNVGVQYQKSLRLAHCL